MIMAVTPNTDLYLLQCPIELDNRNQINFRSAEAQFNYFYNLPKLEAENFTYQRKDNIIRFPAHIDSLLSYTYVMYRNTNYGSKWFYAYITDMQYINDNMTAITISTDVWQTWCFNLSIKKSFVEREHVSNDAIGQHTVPEGLEYGEYVCNAEQSYDAGSPNTSTGPYNLYACIQTTYNYGVGGDRIYNGIFQGSYVFAFPYNLTGLSGLQILITNLDAIGRGEAIISLFMIPRDITTWNQVTIPLHDKDGNPTGSTIPAYVPSTTWGAKLMHLETLYINSTINGYTPKNNKLFVAPYNFIQVSNHVGQASEYNYEDFDIPTRADFNVYGAFSQGGSFMSVPYNYKKVGSTSSLAYVDYGVSGAKYPQLSWLSDYYLNWQAQNGANIAVQATQSAVNFGLSTAGAMMGKEPSYGVRSLADDVASIALQIRQAKMTPDNIRGNIATGDVILSMKQYGFTYRKMSIKYEYARIIDEYFSMFGYKVNTCKIPQFTSRRNWNYIRTRGIAIEAQIPQADLQSIKDIFNNGVTMWHNPSTFMDYSQSNNIV